MGKNTTPDMLLIDRAAILDHLEGDMELLHEIATIYLESYPDLLSDIRDAVSGGDRNRLSKAAHKLKGAVATFQAATVLEPLLHLEAAARQGDLSTAEELLRRLEAELQKLERALISLVEEPVSALTSEDSLAY